MKYTNKQMKETRTRLKRELENIARKTELPSALQTQTFMTALPEQVSEKSTKCLEPRHIACAAAAAVIVLLSVALLYPPSRAIFGSMASGEQEPSGSTTALQDGKVPTESGRNGTSEEAAQSQTQAPPQAVTQAAQDGAKAQQLDARIDRANSYAHIDAVFETLRKAYMRDASLQNGSLAPGKAVTVPSAAKAPDKAPNNEMRESDSFESSTVGKTNTQVAGVDEADVLKNDGKYLYLAKNYDNEYDTGGNYKAARPSTVTVVALQSGGKMEKKTVIPITPQNAEKGERITGLFLWNGKLAVLTQQYADAFSAGYELYSRSCYGAYHAQKTLIRVYALDNIQKPKLETTWSQDGGYLSARLTGDTLCVVSNYSVSLAQDAEKDAVYPKTGVNGREERIEASSLYVPKTKPEPNYLVVTTASLARSGEKPKKAAVLGCGETVYCTGDRLYAARSVYQDAGEVTEIYQFSVNGAPNFTASGVVKGRMLNQFSMDAHQGSLRVVTTQSTWDEGSNQRKTDNALYVLDAKLKQVGSVHNLAPGETVQSVRFAGDTAYVVTFLQTDPLFVIDCSNPQKPVVQGELKIPGFSSYLHPVTENLVIGIGRPGNDSGTTEGIKLSLFDVSNPKKPLEVDQITIGSGYYNSYTPAWSEHKALFYYAEKALFGFPICINEQWRIDTFRVDIAAKKLLRDKVYRSDIYEMDSVSQRVTYVNETLYGWFGNTLLSYSMQSGRGLSELAV